MIRNTLTYVLMASCAVVPLLAGCGWVDAPPTSATAGNSQSSDATSQAASTAASEDSPTVRVALFNSDGSLVHDVESAIVERTPAQWKSRLSADQFRILRGSGTERAFTGSLLENKEQGVYTCAGCGLPLFSSESKFKSGTGWPSFSDRIATTNVTTKTDATLGMVRTEINCARCDGHLGHVFDDGPAPTGKRYCVNSVSLGFTEMNKLDQIAEDGATEAAALRKNLKKAVFAGGCFWCVEAVFEELAGVHEVVSGYTGGASASTANYKDVCSGQSGHAEAVLILYDPNVIALEDLLRVHFATHDPTQLNRQGADRGTQYRSAIFFEDETGKSIAEAFISDLTEQGVFDAPIVTTIEPLTKFFEAERYHQNYVCENMGQSYVRAVALPKVEKTRKQFKDLLKKDNEERR